MLNLRCVFGGVLRLRGFVCAHKPTPGSARCSKHDLNRLKRKNFAAE